MEPGKRMTNCGLVAQVWVSCSPSGGSTIRWPIASILGRGLSLLLAIAMVTALVLPVGHTQAQTRASQIASQNCAVDNEEAFRARLVALTDNAFRNGLGRIDFNLAVDDQWRENRMDALIDRLVDEQTEIVKDETDWDQLLASLVSSEKLQSLAEQLATRVYRSDAFKEATIDLATDAANSVAAEVELATLDAAGPAVRCVRAYLGSRFGSTIARMVADDTRTSFAPDPQAGTADVGVGDLAVSSQEALAGIMVLAARRLFTRITQRIGQRVVGVVVARVVSTVAGGVGVLLILKDVWDLRNGFLPTIADEMKSDDSKQGVRVEMAKALEEQTTAQISVISSAIADRIIDVWREFQVANAKVVELAGEIPDFKRFLGAVRRDDLPRVDRIVGIILQSEGRDGITWRLGDGTLATAVSRLPGEAIEIASDTRSLSEAFAWQRAAGDRLGSVLQSGLHRELNAAALTPRALQRLLDVDDGLALGKLRILDPVALEALTEFPIDELRALARRLSGDELNQFSAYLTALSPDARRTMLDLTGGDPARIRKLTPNYVRNAVIASRDQSAAVNMVLRNGPLFDLPAAERDVRAVLDGAVSPVLLWPSHPVVVVAAGVGVLLILLFFNRIFGGGSGGRRGREPKPSIEDGPVHLAPRT